MHSYELVVFDCDGVLVDSERITNKIFVSMAAQYGVDLTLEELVAKYVGLTLSTGMEMIQREYGVRFPHSFIADFNTKSRESLAKDLTEIPGVSDLVRGLELPYCVASNSSPEKVAFMLEVAGLKDLFNGNIFSAAQVAKPKPAPDVYLLAAATYDKHPEKCLVIEDSPTGVKAAKAAGMTVYGYAGLFPGGRLLEAGADTVFHHMHEITPTLCGLSMLLKP